MWIWEGIMEWSGSGKTYQAGPERQRRTASTCRESSYTATTVGGAEQSVSGAPLVGRAAYCHYRERSIHLEGTA